MQHTKSGLLLLCLVNVQHCYSLSTYSTGN